VTRVQRYSYSFQVKPMFRLGTPVEFVVRGKIDRDFDANIVVINCPSPNFALLDTLDVAGVKLCEHHLTDAYVYRVQGENLVRLPKLRAGDEVVMAGAYTGIVPEGYEEGFGFQFIMTLQSPSDIVGYTREAER